MAAEKTGTPLDFAVEAATFYGGLVANGVPPSQATQMTGQFIQSTIFVRLAGGQKPRNPWEDS